ncbi:MAG: hypothetical protein IJZ87_08705 [Bacteroidales bacterium]|nr:hypothetical protein [Bacteroidales bacterium]
MNYFEIKPDGQAYIRTDSGTVLRKVGNGEAVNHADFDKDETLFVITYNSGKSEVRDRKNNLIKIIAEEGVKEAFWRKYYIENEERKQSKSAPKEYILLIMKNGENRIIEY